MKKQNNNIRNTIDLIVNMVIVVATLIAILVYFIGGKDHLGVSGVACFRYFTTDSNLLAAFASLLYIIVRWIKKEVPRWIHVLKFVGTVSVTLTFLTVVFFLAPSSMMWGGGIGAALRFFAGNVFILHLLTPVLSIVSELFLEKDAPVTWKQSLWGMLPTAVYGGVYVTMVIFVKKWYDWYGFTFGGRFELAPVSIAAMLLLTFAIASLERWIRNKKSHGKKK